MPGNAQVLQLRKLSASCMRYLVGMKAIAIGYDWPGIYAVAQMAGIKMNLPTVRKLRELEAMDIKYLNSKGGGQLGSKRS